MFNLISVFWHWWIIGLCLLIIELFVPGAFFLWIGVSAFVTGLIAWVLPLSIEVQLILFSALSIVSIVCWKLYQKKHVSGPSEEIYPILNQRSSQYVGRTFTLESPIMDGQGRVRVEDTIWKVQGPDLPAGSKVTVIQVQGVILIVEEA